MSLAYTSGYTVAISYSWVVEGRDAFFCAMLQAANAKAPKSITPPVW
jgi:hypothetical protein